MSNKNTKNIFLVIVAFISRMLIAADAGPGCRCVTLPTAGASEFLCSFDAGDRESLDTLSEIFNNGALRQPEKSFLVMAILEKLCVCGKSAFALACMAGDKKLAASLVHETHVKDVEVQRALVGAAYYKHADIVKILIKGWSHNSHNYLGWAREEAVALAIKSNDRETLDALLRSASPLQFQTLEDEINDAFNDGQTFEVALHVLDCCTREQRKKIIGVAHRNHHDALARYILAVYDIARATFKPLEPIQEIMDEEPRTAVKPPVHPSFSVKVAQSELMVRRRVKHLSCPVVDKNLPEGFLITPITPLTGDSLLFDMSP